MHTLNEAIDLTPDTGPKGRLFVADAGLLAYLECTGGPTVRLRIDDVVTRRTTDRT